MFVLSDLDTNSLILLFSHNFKAIWLKNMFVIIELKGNVNDDIESLNALQACT